MQLTRIADENADFFAHLCPEELLYDDSLVKLGVIEKDEPISICIVGINDDMAAIRWFYTDPDKRMQGGATFLMNETLRILEELSLEGIEVDFDPEDEELEEFLMERDFLVDEDTEMYRVPIEDIYYSAEMDELLYGRRGNTEITSIANPRGDSAIREYLKEYEGSTGLDEELLLDSSRDFSRICLNEKGKMVAGIFFAEVGDKDLRLNYMIGNGSPQVMADLICFVYDELTMMDRTEGDFIFSDRTGVGIAFVEQMTGNDRSVYRVPGHMYAVRMM